MIGIGGGTVCEVKPSSNLSCLYDLVANIPHEASTASTGQAAAGTIKKGEKEEGETVWKVRHILVYTSMKIKMG